MTLTEQNYQEEIIDLAEKLWKLEIPVIVKKRKNGKNYLFISEAQLYIELNDGLFHQDSNKITIPISMTHNNSEKIINFINSIFHKRMNSYEDGYKE